MPKLGVGSKAWTEDEGYRAMPRALLGGTRAMRAATKTYLPEHSAEDAIPPESPSGKTAYAVRCEMSVLYPFFEQAVNKAVGAILRNPIKLQADVPAAIRDKIWEDIDRKGNIGDAFLRPVIEDAIGESGVSFVLVDYPEVKGESLADLKPSDRPYWVHVRAADVLNPENWQWIDGVPRFTVLRTRADSYDEENEFETKLTARERIYRRAGAPGNPFPDSASVEVWVKVKKENTQEDEWVPEGPPMPLRPHLEIPIHPLYLRKKGELRGRCCFEHLAYLCVSHWQKLSDKDMTLFRIAPPIHHRVGISVKEAREQSVIGGGSLWVSTDQNARAEVIEHSGSAVGVIQNDIERLEARILAWSNEPHIQRAASDTATGRLIDYEHARTEIQAWAMMVKDFVEECLLLTAMYLQLDSGGSVEVAAAKRDDARDLDKIRVAADSMREYGVDPEEALLELQRGGVFSDDFDVAKALENADTNGVGEDGRKLEFTRKILARVAAGEDVEAAIDAEMMEGEEE